LESTFPPKLRNRASPENGESSMTFSSKTPMADDEDFERYPYMPRQTQIASLSRSLDSGLSVRFSMWSTLIISTRFFFSFFLFCEHDDDERFDIKLYRRSLPARLQLPTSLLLPFRPKHSKILLQKVLQRPNPAFS